MQLNKKYDTEKKRQRAVSDLQALQATKGWEIIKELIQGEIEFLKNQIVSGKDNKGNFLDPEETNRLRNNLEVHEELIQSPDFLIKKLNQPPAEEKELEDPYD